MAIEKRYVGRTHYYALICDHCGEEAGEFDTFQDAVDGKKDTGYRSINEKGQWSDYCPDCLDLFNYKSGTSATEDFRDV